MEAVVPSRNPQSKTKLFKYSQQELDNLFDTLPLIDFEKLEGVYRGRLFAIIGLGLLPRLLRRVIYTVLQTLVNPWKGKSFKNLEGANVWFGLSRQYRFGYYNVIPAKDDESGYLNYDVDKNMGLLRPVRGEARQLDGGKVLARMNYVTKNKTYRVLYFTLEATNETDG